MKWFPHLFAASPCNPASICRRKLFKDVKADISPLVSQEDLHNVKRIIERRAERENEKKGTHKTSA